MRNVIAGALLLLSLSCANSSFPGSPGGSVQPPTDLASAKQAWQQAGITDYTMSVRVTGCMACGEPFEYSVTVVDGEVTEQTSPPFLRHPEAATVEQLFRWLEFWAPDNIRATYNEFGVPTEVHGDNPEMSDDQADYHVTFSPSESTQADDAEATPQESNSDTTGPSSACPDGAESYGVLDYGAPSPEAKQSREEALASYNEWKKNTTYVMTSDGWAVSTDDAGNVTGVVTFEELGKGYFVIGGEIGCR